MMRSARRCVSVQGCRLLGNPTERNGTIICIQNAYFR